MELQYHTYENRNWIDGIIDGCHFSAEVFDEASRYGINKGRISRFNMVDKGGNLVVYYDRGWNVRPRGKMKELYTTVLNFFESFSVGERQEKIIKTNIETIKSEI